jgi:23S rRNA (adenine2503-C2)-methyltransferase
VIDELEAGQGVSLEGMRETRLETRNLIGLTRAEFEQLALDYGQSRYRGAQLYHALYGRRAQSFDALHEVDQRFREELAARHALAYPSIARRIVSRDESVRYLLSLEDGATVETVYMPWRVEDRDGRPVRTPSGRTLRAVRRERLQPRSTLCISSQVGCAVDCKFCFTGLLGLKRNLTAGEIVGQVLAIADDQKLRLAAPARGARSPAPERVNVVFMGQGEPLLNYGAVMKAVEILADSAACGIALRRITVSTVGIVPRIHDLAREAARPKLAISLNASSDEQRTALVPINRKYPLGELMAACSAYPLRPRERLTFEYVMLDGVNDSDLDAARVAKLLGGIPSRVNLIPYNAGPGLPYRASPMERVEGFQRVLAKHGVPAFIRISRGQDIMAACGQLSLAETATVA